MTRIGTVPEIGEIAADGGYFGAAQPLTDRQCLRERRRRGRNIVRPVRAASQARQRVRLVHGGTGGAGEGARLVEQGTWVTCRRVVQREIADAVERVEF